MPTRTTPGITPALTIAGSDPSGGAGIQADLKTFAAMNVFGCAVITAVTAQNTTAVKGSQPMDAALIEQQIDAVAGDIPIQAAKTGMLANEAVVKATAKAIRRNKIAPLVVDPVMIATTGDRLTDDPAIKAIGQSLLPLAAIVTPNGREAASLLNRSDPVTDVFSAAEAAKQICRQFGAKACVVTGIQRNHDQETEAVDVYFDGSEIHEIASQWRATSNLHGSGCTFSAALTGALASGQPIEEAVRTAKTVVSEAIRQTTDLGHGSSPVNHLAYMQIKK